MPFLLIEIGGFYRYEVSGISTNYVTISRCYNRQKSCSNCRKSEKNWNVMLDLWTTFSVLRTKGICNARVVFLYPSMNSINKLNWRISIYDEKIINFDIICQVSSVHVWYGNFKENSTYTLLYVW